MRNPFVIDRPLSQDDLYYGRDNAFALLKQHMAIGTRLFFVATPPGSGKTSLLHQLPLRMTRHTVKTVSWHDIAGSNDSAEALPGLGLALLGDMDEGPRILCIDAIPCQRNEDSVAWRNAGTELAESLSAGDNVALVLAFECMPGDHIEIPAAVELPLDALSEREVQDLLMIPSRRRLAWGLDAAQRIYRLSGGDPLLCQLYGHIVFEKRAGSGWVSMIDIDGTTRDIVERQHGRLQSMWEACSPTAQLVLCSLAEMPGRRDLAHAEDVDTYLRQQLIQVTAEQIAQGLAELSALGLVSRLGGETYRITFEIMRHWLQEHHDLASVLAEHRLFRQNRVQATSWLQSDRIDWVGLGLWAVAAALLITIGYVWRSRETIVFWTATPTPHVGDTVVYPTPRVLQTPEKGTAPGHIVYQAKEETDHHWSLYAMRSDGSDPVRLTDANGNDTLPVWSPDGRHIVFVSDRDGNREVYTMNADGNDQRNLTVHGAEDWTPTWSPDGQEIAFASFRDGNWDLYVMSSDGGETTRLTSDPSSEYSPSWSPDGELLAFVSNRDGDLNIYVMSLSDGETWRITEDTATDQNPAWRPDGAQLIWESYRENNMEIFVANVDGSDMGPLSRDAYADDHGACWSPWGQSVVFYSNRDEGWDIYTYSTETSERLNLTQSPMLEQAPNWGP